MSTVAAGRAEYLRKHPNAAPEPPEPEKAKSGIAAGARAYARARRGLSTGTRWEAAPRGGTDVTPPERSA